MIVRLPKWKHIGIPVTIKAKARESLQHTHRPSVTVPY